MATMAELRGGLQGLSALALNAVLPPRCLSCRAAVERTGALCAACWEQVAFIAPPICDLCGYPFEFELGGEALCGNCLRAPPAYDRGRAVMAYNEGSKGLVLGFKHSDRTEGAASFAAWMARAGAELLEDAEVIVPVPLHRWRLFQRRYNQAALLVRSLGQATRLPVVHDALVRRRNTPTQGRLSAAARRQNVAGAFAIQPSRQGLIEGRSVLLVDDVLTTGATAEACARMLRRAGAAAVDVLVLARVLRADF